MLFFLGGRETATKADRRARGQKKAINHHQRIPGKEQETIIPSIHFILTTSPLYPINQFQYQIPCRGYSSSAHSSSPPSSQRCSAPPASFFKTSRPISPDSTRSTSVTRLIQSVMWTMRPTNVTQNSSRKFVICIHVNPRHIQSIDLFIFRNTRDAGYDFCTESHLWEAVCDENDSCKDLQYKINSAVNVRKYFYILLYGRDVKNQPIW